MKKHHQYIAVALVLAVLVLLLVYLQCSTDGTNSQSSVDVTYYFNPGCPHCRNFMPVWRDFASSGGANFKEINCATNPELCQNIKAVPWVVFSKSGSSSVPFMGNRDKQTLKAFLNGMN